MNLLPEELKKQIRRDYLYRLASLFFVAFGFLGLIAVGLLYPSFEYSRRRVELFESQIDQAFTPGTDANASREQSENLTKIVHFLKSDNKVQVSDALAIIMGKISNDISVRSIDIRIAQDSSEVVFVGNASNREALKKFNEALMSDNRFSEISIPLSSFARDRDLEFSSQFKILNIQNEE